MTAGYQSAAILGEQIEADRLNRAASMGAAICLLLLAYLAALAILHLLARRSRSRLLRRLVLVLTPKFMGVMLAGAIATAAPVAAQTKSLAPSLSGPSDGVATSSLPMMTVSASDPPVMKVIPDTAENRTSLPWASSLDSAPVVDDTTVRPADDTGLSEIPGSIEQTTSAGGAYLVTPGDHFWSIANSTLRSSMQGEPSKDQVHEYWIQLVEANRSRLVDPQNADLIFPGQELLLPPLS